MGGVPVDREVRNALAAAADRAAELGHSYVGTEHLLLGLVRTAATLFPDPATVTDLEHRVYSLTGRSAGPRSTGSDRALPYTSLAKRALQHALDAARRGGATAVGTPHLLQGLLADDRGIAGKVLRESGIQTEGPSEDPQTGASWDVALGLIRIDDEAELPYYEQLVASVKESVAAGHLNPGDRLPPVRRLADSLELAPGTVARAYSLLEREGVIETAGPKGTTVAFPRGSTPAADRDHVEELAGLLRPTVVAAFHLGSTAEDLFEALRRAIAGVFDGPLPQ